MSDFTVASQQLTLDQNFKQSGAWEFVYSRDSFNDHLLRAFAPNSSASYQFAGRDIAVYGHEDPLPQGAQPAQSAYSLNGTQLGTHTAGQSKANAAFFFHASNLPTGTHTLTISVLQASNASSYYLDWVEYNVTLSSSQSSSITGSSSAISSPSASSRSAASGSRKTLPVGAIVGIAVGATFLFCCATLLLVRKWRRRRAARLAGDFAYGPKGHYDGMTTVPDMVSPESGGQRVYSQDSGPLLDAQSPMSDADRGSAARLHSPDAASTSAAHAEAEEVPGSFDELMDDDVLPAYSP